MLPAAAPGPILAACAVAVSPLSPPAPELLCLFLLQVWAMLSALCLPFLFKFHQCFSWKRLVPAGRWWSSQGDRVAVTQDVTSASLGHIGSLGKSCFWRFWVRRLPGTALRELCPAPSRCFLPAAPKPLPFLERSEDFAFKTSMSRSVLSVLCSATLLLFSMWMWVSSLTRNESTGVFVC